MTLADTISTTLKRVASTNGGEWAGPCPQCGGTDRFRVWPKEGETGRYWCRQCDWKGDGVQFIRDTEAAGYQEARKRLGLPTDLRYNGTQTNGQQKSSVFWTQKRLAKLQAGQKSLKVGHALVDMSRERDGIEPETYQAFGCAIWTEWGQDWLAFPYRTGCQLYRRDGGKKVIVSVTGSKPTESLFGTRQLQGAPQLIIAKSPRETMLMRYVLGEAVDVIGLPGGESGNLSNEQADILRRITGLESVRTVLDTDTDQARRIAEQFAAAVADAVAVPVFRVDVSQTGHKDVTDVFRDEGAEAVANALACGDVIGCRENNVPLPIATDVQWRPFPTDALPKEAVDYVRATALALNCDEAMIGVPVLVVLAAAVGNSHRVRIKRLWDEPATLWAAIAMPSGQMKSPALKAATDPLVSLEIKLKAEWEGRLRVYEEEQREYEKLPRGEKNAPSRSVKPIRRRLRVSDITIESIALLHADNPRGLLLARDELAGWIGSFDSYKRGASDVHAWVEMFDGRYLQVDRKSMTPSVLDIPWPAVSVVGTVQPEILARKLKEDHFHSGFVPRIMIVSPPVRRRSWTDADVTADVREGYFGLVRRLYGLPSDDEPRVVSLSSEAKEVYIDFYNENAERMHEIHSGTLKSALSKVEAVAARIALVLHLADCAQNAGGAESASCNDVSTEAMKRATDLARWFRNETIRVYRLFQFDSKSLSRDERLTGRLPNEFTYRDVMGLWEVKKRASYDVINRLISKGLARDDGHGKYRKCTMHNVHSPH